MPVSQAGELDTRVVVVPLATLPPDQETAFWTVCLRHPRTIEAGAAVLHNLATGTTASYSPSQRSAWFIG
jgi:hypothetical protein